MFWLQSNKHLFSSSVVKSQAWFFSTLTLHHELKDNEHQISCANVNKKRVGPGSLWDIGPPRTLKDGFFIVSCLSEWARNARMNPKFITLLISVMNFGFISTCILSSFRLAGNKGNLSFKSPNLPPYFY